METEAEAQVCRARDLLKMGDYVGVYDVAQKALENDSADPALLYLAVLGLARSGAISQAMHFYGQVKSRLPLSEENLSLEARLYKDQFLACQDPPKKNKLGLQARDLYLRAYQIQKNYYPAINAATLSLLIDDADACRSLAEEVLHICDTTPLAGNASDYFVHVTRAEACLLLERDAEAAEALQQARETSANDFGNLSTSFRQLSLICQARGLATEVVEILRPPTVITFTGQTLHGLGKSAGIDPDDEEMIRAQVRDVLSQYNVKIAYGSLACGADLIVAEEILNVGGELNVVLPFSREDFKRTSVTPGGPSWEKKFDTVLERSATVSLIVDDAYTGYDLLYETCSLQIMGLAHLRAQTLGSRTYQLALWNGLPSASAAGTASAMQRWKSLGEENLVITIPPPRRPGATPVTEPVQSKNKLKRQMKSMIFADIQGYGGMNENQLPMFTALWLAKLEDIHRDYSDKILYLNTWGDAVFFIVDSVVTAADISLALARMFPEKELTAQGLPDRLGLRVAVHVGPIFGMHNPLTGHREFFGTHVTQAARLEPCTPVGSVYVTEPFAAMISIEGQGKYRCEYVGNHPLPKNYGKIRMYHLDKD